MSWETALDTVASGLRETIARHGPEAVALLRVGPAPDRGLLRRQQAGQRLPRHRQHRHQLAALHGLVGRGPQARLRQRHRARPIRGLRAGRPRRAGRQQSRLVPSGAVPAAGSRQACAAGHEDRRDRSAAHRDLRHRRSASGAEAGQRRGAVQWSAGLAASARRRSRRTSSSATPIGLEAALAAAQASDVVDCDLPAADSPPSSTGSPRTEKTVTLYSQGVNQSSAGVDKVNALINCHLLTGRIGRPGMGPFSITGQPNAMGGREVGALSNTLAAHMDFAPADVDRVAPLLARAAHRDQPGLKAVDLFDAVGRGEIKAVWIMATNPVASLPNADAVRAALGSLRVRRSSPRRSAPATPSMPAASVCRRSPGRRRTAPSPTPSAASRASGVPAGARRGAAGLVDREPGRAPPRLRRRLCLEQRRRHLPRARGAVGLRERRHARFRHRRTCRDRRRGLRRAGAVRLGRRIASSAMALLPCRPPCAVHRDGPACSGACADDRAPAAAQHRPRARPVAHHDPHREVGAARGPSARADGRASSARGRGARHRRRLDRRRSKAAGAGR